MKQKICPNLEEPWLQAGSGCVDLRRGLDEERFAHVKIAQMFESKTAM